MLGRKRYGSGSGRSQVTMVPSDGGSEDTVQPGAGHGPAQMVDNRNRHMGPVGNAPMIDLSKSSELP